MCDWFRDSISLTIKFFFAAVIVSSFLVDIPYARAERGSTRVVDIDGSIKVDQAYAKKLGNYFRPTEFLKKLSRDRPQSGIQLAFLFLWTNYMTVNCKDGVEYGRLMIAGPTLNLSIKSSQMGIPIIAKSLSCRGDSNLDLPINVAFNNLPEGLSAKDYITGYPKFTRQLPFGPKPASSNNIHPLPYPIVTGAYGNSILIYDVCNKKYCLSEILYVGNNGNLQQVDFRMSNRYAENATPKLY